MRTTEPEVTRVMGDVAAVEPGRWSVDEMRSGCAASRTALDSDPPSRVITTGHAFIQNIRRDHYEVGAVNDLA